MYGLSGLCMVSGTLPSYTVYGLDLYHVVNIETLNVKTAMGVLMTKCITFLFVCLFSVGKRKKNKIPTVEKRKFIKLL